MAMSNNQMVSYFTPIQQYLGARRTLPIFSSRWETDGPQIVDYCKNGSVKKTLIASDCWLCHGLSWLVSNFLPNKCDSMAQWGFKLNSLWWMVSTTRTHKKHFITPQTKKTKQPCPRLVWPVGQWIGLREKWNRTPLYISNWEINGTSIPSGKLSLHSLRTGKKHRKLGKPTINQLFFHWFCGEFPPFSEAGVDQKSPIQFPGATVRRLPKPEATRK